MKGHRQTVNPFSVGGRDSKLYFSMPIGRDPPILKIVFLCAYRTRPSRPQNCISLRIGQDPLVLTLIKTCLANQRLLVT